MTVGKRLVKCAAALAAVLSVTVACTSRPPTVADTEIVWATGGIAAAGPAADVAALWNAQHPSGPRVRVAGLPAGSDGQRQLLSLELNAALPTFDVLDLDMIWTAEFAGRGWLRELEDLRGDLEPVTLAGPLSTAEWDGQLWAAPYTTDAGVLYYRKDLLPGGPPRTWEEAVDVGRRVGQANGIAPFVSDGQQYEGLTVQFLEYLWAAGGDLTAGSGCGAAVPQDPARRALSFMASSYSDGFYSRNFDRASLEEARRTFQSGGALFLRSWPYAYRLMNGADRATRVAGKVGIAPLPVFRGGSDAPTTPALGGHNLGVSSFSRHPEAATDFVRFVATSPQVQRLLAQRHSLAPTLQSTYDELATDPMMVYLEATLPLARPRPPTPDWSSVSEEIQQQVFAAYIGAKKPEVAVNDLRAALAPTPSCG